jgi:hypothetical protein
MSTIDVFNTATNAMSVFVDVPLAGHAYSIQATAYGEAKVYLDDGQQPAQALLAWMGMLSKREIRHWHSDGRLFVEVTGTLGGVNWNLWSTFEGHDQRVLCDHDDDRGSVSLHRLRAVQIRQIAAAVAR